MGSLFKNAAGTQHPEGRVVKNHGLGNDQLAHIVQEVVQFFHIHPNGLHQLAACWMLAAIFGPFRCSENRFAFRFDAAFAACFRRLLTLQALEHLYQRSFGRQVLFFAGSQLLDAFAQGIHCFQQKRALRRLRRTPLTQRFQH